MFKLIEHTKYKCYYQVFDMQLNIIILYQSTVNL